MTTKKALTISLLTIALTGITAGIITYSKKTGKNPFKVQQTQAYYEIDSYENNTLVIYGNKNTQYETTYYTQNEYKITHTNYSKYLTIEYKTTNFYGTPTGQEGYPAPSYKYLMQEYNLLAGISSSSLTAINYIEIYQTNLIANNTSAITTTFTINVNIKYHKTIPRPQDITTTIQVTNLTYQESLYQTGTADDNSTFLIDYIPVLSLKNSLIEQFNNGYDSGEQISYDSGYADGYTAGESAGQTTGYTEGYNEGQTAGYTEGYEAGLEATDQEAIYNNGYNAGYGIGYNDAENFSNPIDIRGLILNIITMPFTFISQAFDVTFWEGTQYEFHLAGFIKGLIAIATILFIIKLFTSGFSAIGNYTGNRDNRKLTRAKIENTKAQTRRTNNLADKGK